MAPTNKVHVTESRSNLSSSCLLLSILELSDTKVYAPYTRALLGTASHFAQLQPDNPVVARCVDRFAVVSQLGYHQPSEKNSRLFFRSLNRPGARRNPATSGTNQALGKDDLPPL